MESPVVDRYLIAQPSRAGDGVRLRPLGLSHPGRQVRVVNSCRVSSLCRMSSLSSYNQNAECKIRSKPTLGLPSVETVCLRLGVTCCHVLSYAVTS
jgi:hypothetical protein